MKRLALLLFALPCLLWCESPVTPQAIATRNRAPLQQNVFNPLPLGAVTPKGWLRKQLEIQAAGLTGHLDEFWNDVGPNSGWLGGTGESWERGPYYLDGLLPLAYELNDQKLKAKAAKWVEWTLNSQRAEGQFGPAKNDDWWPRMVMLKVLTQYEEATGDPRVIPFMTRYFAYEQHELPKRPLFEWGKYRWQDNVYSVLWLYNRTGDSGLLDLARLLHDQGYDWEKQFALFQYTEKQTAVGLGFNTKTPKKDQAMQTHGVNNAMALKVAPIWWLVSGSAGDRAAFARQMAELDQYHGLPNGMFSGDEHLAGTDPSQGIELCAVVESMFSLEENFAILGNAAIADRLERISYNALPATLSEDMWSHQYDQQPNQIACTRAHRQWSTNGDQSNLFGLEPNFGCCTANLHQGWPKLVSSLWMAAADGGLTVVAYAPSEVRASLDRTVVTIEENTDYPFRGDVQFVVHSPRAKSFPLILRLPAWAASMNVRVNGTTKGVSAAETKDHLYRLERTWRDGDMVEVSFPMQPQVSHWFHGAAVFERGPLVFSLALDARWEELKKYAEKSADWQLTPTVPWNYALELGECDAKAREHPIGEVPFNAKQPAVTLTVRGKQLPSWTMSEGSAGPVPISPVSSAEPLKELTLVPYGAAKLRVTAFPFLREHAQCAAAEHTRSRSGAK